MSKCLSCGGALTQLDATSGVLRCTDCHTTFVHADAASGTELIPEAETGGDAAKTRSRMELLEQLMRIEDEIGSVNRQKADAAAVYNTRLAELRTTLGETLTLLKQL